MLTELDRIQELYDKWTMTGLYQHDRVSPNIMSGQSFTHRTSHLELMTQSQVLSLYTITLPSNYLATHLFLRIPALRPIGRAINLVLNAIDASTRIQVSATGALHIDIRDADILAHSRARAHQVSNKRIVLLARRAFEVLDRDVRDGEFGGELSKGLGLA